MTPITEREAQRPQLYVPPIVGDDGAKLRQTVLHAANVVTRHTRLLWALPLAFAVLSVLPSYVFGRKYVAQSSFMPELSANGSNRFAGLAAQFGINLAAGSGGESLDSYVEIANSRAILSEVIQKQYHFEDGFRRRPATGTLLDAYHASGKTPSERLLAGIKALRSNLSVTADPKPSMIVVQTNANSRELAEAINRNILDAVAEFNLRKRQSRASAERAFVSDRLAKAQDDVRVAENAAEDFLARNRTYAGSPQLLLEYTRLQRRVDLVQQVATTLAQANEQARIEEVRNTPVITIIDPPEGSATVAKSRRVQAITGFAIGLVLAIALAFLIEAVRDLRQRDGEALETIVGRVPLLGRVIRRLD